MPRAFPPRHGAHRIARLLAVASLAILPAAHAADTAPELVVRHGSGDPHISRDGLGLRLGPLWNDRYGSWALALHPELELGRFRYSGHAGGPDHLDEAAGIGVLRIESATGSWRPYAELGLGLAWFGNSRLGRKDFSTHLQFTESLTLGLRVGERWSLGWQYSHYSNGDIKLPNDGVDLQQLVVGVRF